MYKNTAREEDMIVIRFSRSDWETILDALWYAVDDRRFQAEYTEDPEDRSTIECCADTWSSLSSELEKYVYGSLTAIEIGEEYVFFYRHDDGDTELLASYNARKCKVVNNDTRCDVMEDIAYGGLYEVIFEDGAEFDVFGDELISLEKCESSRHGIYWVKM